MLSLMVAAGCLVGSVFAQLPPSYSLAHTNTTLGVQYGGVDVAPGSTLGFKGQHLPEAQVFDQEIDNRIQFRHRHRL